MVKFIKSIPYSRINESDVNEELECDSSVVLLQELDDEAEEHGEVQRKVVDRPKEGSLIHFGIVCLLTCAGVLLVANFRPFHSIQLINHRIAFNFIIIGVFLFIYLIFAAFHTSMV